MLENHKNLPKNIHFLYGGKSWLESSVGEKIIKELEESDSNFNCTVTVVDEATHHLQCTHPDRVNSVVNQILKSAEGN
jgi:pimeloyl-ACP methyl ester carboxylesterase